MKKGKLFIKRIAILIGFLREWIFFRHWASRWTFDMSIEFVLHAFFWVICNKNPFTC